MENRKKKKKKKQQTQIFAVLSKGTIDIESKTPSHLNLKTPLSQKFHKPLPKLSHAPYLTPGGGVSSPPFIQTDSFSHPALPLLRATDYRYTKNKF